MKIKKKLAVTLTLMMTLSIISTNNYALENSTGNETKKEQKEEIVITKEKDDKKLEDTSDKTKKNLSVTRISGSDRYDTSVNISEYMKTYMKPYKNIVVASGEIFPDAISAGILSCHLESPLLLVKRNTIPEVVENNIREMKNLNYTAVVGGESTITRNVENNLSKYSKKKIRIAGKDRYITSQLSESSLDTILNGYPGTASDIVDVYNGNNYSDALAATPFMYNNYRKGEDKLALIAIRPNGNTSELIRMVFGGENSVNKYKEKYRFAGQDRYKTAVEIAKAYKNLLKMDIDTIVLASGEDYPDALCAGPLASSKNAAILLTNSKTLNEDTREYIKSNTNIKNIIIVGGEKSISSSVEDELKTLR